MEDLGTEVLKDAVTDVPSQKEAPVEEAELTDEQLQEEVTRLKEEAKNQEDPKEKRHLEQQAGWSEKVLKEREKAKNLEKSNQEKEESLRKFESTLVEEVYEKAIDENYGLPYFEKLAKSDPKLAEKVAQDKWGKSAKEMILASKRELAEKGDEDSKKELQEEEQQSNSDAKAEHKVAVREANKMFADLEDSEREIAKKYFEKISGKSLLTVEEAEEFADMAKHYATRSKVDKEKVLAQKATTGIKQTIVEAEPKVDKAELKQQLINAGIPSYLAEQLAA